MKFDVALPCFFGDLPFAEGIKKAKELGYDAVETYDWTRLDLDEAKRALDENEVTLLSVCTSFFNMTEPEYRDTYLENLRESCIAVKKLGGSKLITQVGNDTGRERAFQHESISETLRQAVPVLEEYGVTLMAEPLNTLVDHKGYYLVSSAEAFDLVKEVNSPFVKVIFDVYHQQVSEGNVINNIRRGIDHIAHFHCAGNPGRHEVQFGELDFKNVFAAIDETGFEGFCGLEYGPILPAEESLREFKRIFS